MHVAIASGKGGTGKTTVATNLARIASRNGRSIAYLDCDVEEPNGHVFLKPEITDRKPVGSLIPRVDVDKCTLCGACGDRPRRRESAGIPRALPRLRRVFACMSC